VSLWLLKVAIVGLREKPSLPLRSLRPLREAKFVVKLASDEAHQNRFRRNKPARDRTALDWALAHAVECGGWCPKGRKAEDGRIDPKYPLRETRSAAYIQRTEWNVRDSDATVLFLD
jgi:Circularly permutated YpsA SLOG family